jgi:hypothetical protein
VIIWKKLNGARFAMPSEETVDTHATGRGAMVEAIQKYEVRRSIVKKSSSIRNRRKRAASGDVPGHTQQF